MPARSSRKRAEPAFEVAAEGETEVPEMDAGAELEGGEEATLSVAELEAMSDEEGDEVLGDEITEEEQEGKVDEPSNFLAVYFREMAQLSILRPEQEIETARQIEQLEIELWCHFLTQAQLTDYFLQLFERTLDNTLPECRTLRRTATEHVRKPTRTTGQKLAQAARTTGERIRAIDIDKRALDVVYREVGRLARGEMPEGEDLKVSHRTKQFREFTQVADQLHNRIHRCKGDFVKANLRLVVSIARRFNHGRMALPDLIQEGNIGLMKAVERYDYHRGYRFSTYASWWIRHAISRALADKGRAVRLPVHMIDAYHRVARSKRELSSKLGRQPTSDEIGDATGIAPMKIEKMRTYLLDQSFSLDRSMSDEDGRRFIDFIADPEGGEDVPMDRLAEAAMNTEVRRLLEDLKPIEADILRRRFGLDDDNELTLKEIGEKYNLSRERIRQLQEQALTKMRRALQRRDLT
ncbi:MAG TPA: sigma-70 family RNA polymerase sigma factor [Polyangia bacterium]|jgi:RNA polymerase primary sigma factor|nr:sigma-70 family RNA polymerase sigma factor [Polyangia bacterium]